MGANRLPALHDSAAGQAPSTLQRDARAVIAQAAYVAQQAATCHGLTASHLPRAAAWRRCETARRTHLLS